MAVVIEARILLLLLCLSSAHGYSTYVPDSVCVSQEATHGDGVEPQTSDAPYRINVYPETYEPGSKVQVEIKGNYDTTFKGFFLQARRLAYGYGSLDQALGQFDDIPPPDDTSFVDCGTGTHNAWAHSSSVDKYTRIIWWKSPTRYEGPIVFRATIVQDVTTYWENVLSDELTPMNELQCHQCYYSETNETKDPSVVDNKEACYNNPWAVPLINCVDEYSLSAGFIYRCYTSQWKRVDANGDQRVGIRRGCIGIDSLKYGDVDEVDDIDDIQEIFDFQLGEDDEQVGEAEFCTSSGCNDERAEMYCYKCSYEEFNGAPVTRPGKPAPGPMDKYNCFYHPEKYEECDEPLEPGYVHRCYTSVYSKSTRHGDFVEGIRRGCVAVQSARYGTLTTTDNIIVVQDVFDFTLAPGDEQTGTADLCDAEFCNDEQSELSCYECKYRETNGINDENLDNKDACYYYPWLLNSISCLSEEGPLQKPWEIYRCYTSVYRKTTSYGDIEEGIFRGCVAVHGESATLSQTSDIRTIEETFDFTLPIGDVQTGTATFCDTDDCNDDAAGLQCHQCYYSDTNGVTDNLDFITDENICKNYPSRATVTNCVDTMPLEEGEIYRCFTSTWIATDASNGDYLTGINRGCVAVQESRFGSIRWTSDSQEIQEILGFELGSQFSHTGTTDFCDWDHCNNEYLYEPMWMPWGPYTEVCSRPCGRGTRTRTRSCDDPKPDDYVYCLGPSSESIECNTQSCPVDPIPDPVWTSWSSWGLCSITCGSGGSRTRTRICIDPDVMDNEDCDGLEYQNELCSSPFVCPPIQGFWSSWSSWGGCTDTCGNGERVRTRTCTGVNCQGDSYETASCYIQSCDLQYTPWSPWSACSASCEGGNRQRTRGCYDPRLGRSCNEYTLEIVECNNQDCDEDSDDIDSDDLEIGAVIAIIAGVFGFIILCGIVLLIACVIGRQPPKPRPGYIIR